MDLDYITNENFLLYCAKVYDNPQCFNAAEFYEDLKRVKYIKKLLTRYEKTGELKERLILNHIIILNNVFGPEHTAKILLFKIEYWDYLKPFLIMLNILPGIIEGFGGASEKLRTDDIPMDEAIVGKLRAL